MTASVSNFDQALRGECMKVRSSRTRARGRDRRRANLLPQKRHRPLTVSSGGGGTFNGFSRNYPNESAMRAAEAASVFTSPH